MTPPTFRDELLHLLREFAAEEYQRDMYGQPSQVWNLVTQLEELLESTVIDGDDPLRWLPASSIWRDDDEPAERVETDVQRLQRDATGDRARERTNGDQGGPA